VTSATAIALGGGPRPSLRTRLQSIDQGLMIGTITIAMLIVGSIVVPGILNPENLRNVIRLAAPLSIVAVGAAIVIIGKNVDLSVVAVIGVAAMSTAQLQAVFGWSEISALLFIVVVALAVGLLNGWLVAFVSIPALFITLGTWKLIEGIFNVSVLEGQVLFTNPRDSAIVSWIGRGQVLGIDVPILLTVIVFIGGWAYFRWTSWGELLRTTGDSPPAARLSGLPVRPIVVSTFVISALLAALAGIVYLGLNGSFGRVNSPSEQLMFNAITAAVIGGVSLSGGRGSIFGVIAGVAFIAVFDNLMTLLNVPFTVGAVLRCVLLLAALALDAWLHPRDEETARSDDL
jgi:ribose transport system permease protein